jgi:uncharacterized protein YecE (DUF72 family)
MAIHIGTSGWSYDHWQGILYPHPTPVRARLDYYIERFRTVEVNYTYYRWPPLSTFASWRQRVPDGFLMAVKASRGLTHFSRLASPERWLDRMLPCLDALGEKFGVLLVQLPPQFAADHPRLEAFLEKVPGWCRSAVEFRHPSWNTEETYRMLERFGAAYCVMSGANLPCVLRTTAPFVYVRLHGPDPHHLYGGSYPDDDLRWWADRIREWAAQGRDVFAYFNNDGGGAAVHNALALRHFLGV